MILWEPIQQFADRDHNISELPVQTTRSAPVAWRQDRLKTRLRSVSYILKQSDKASFL